MASAFCSKSNATFPPKTRSTKYESMLGLLQLMTEVERRKLVFPQNKIIPIPSDVLSGQIIQKIMNKYQPEEFLTTLKNSGDFPSNRQWKTITSRTIYNKQQIERQTLVDADNDVRRFAEVRNIKKSTNAWEIPNKTSEMDLSEFVARIWVTSCTP